MNGKSIGLGELNATKWTERPVGTSPVSSERTKVVR